VVATSNILGDKFWVVLSHVGVDDQKQDTCIEELSVENSICDRSELCTDSIFTNPGNESNNAHLQNKINSNNDESDTGTKNLGQGFI
jgi:hypothetical protein